MEEKLIALGVETMQLSLIISGPVLIASLVAGLAISIFQATTQINEQTLSFLPKIILSAIVIILTMPWMMHLLMDFTTKILREIPTFAF
ncbi:MAG: flagellar biosynthesis protein FliQ [Campylobacterales bacterium]